MAKTTVSSGSLSAFDVSRKHRERERFEAKKIVRKILRANNVCAYIPYMVSFAAFRGAAHHLSVLYLLRVLL